MIIMANSVEGWDWTDGGMRLEEGLVKGDVSLICNILMFYMENIVLLIGLIPRNLCRLANYSYTSAFPT